MARVPDAPTATPFVGRDGELARVREALRLAGGGAGSLVLVSGEPGIGKTRLVEEVLLDHRGAQAWGRCGAGVDGPAYRPWVDVLRRLTDRPLVPAPGSDGGPSGLARAGPPGSAFASRARLSAEVVDVLAGAARDGPLVVVLDDLHWADADSTWLLQCVAVEVPRLPVLLLGTYRDTDLGPAAPFAAALPDLARAGTSLQLSGLSPLETERLANAVLETEGRGDGEGVPGPLLHARTGGNPFFARELLRLTGADDPVRGSSLDTRLPGSVRAVVLRRLTRLPQPTYDLLTWAAVAGRSSDVDLLARAARVPVREALAAAEPALAARVVVPVDGHRLSFVHDLVRETLLDAVGLLGRTTRHWALGEAVAAVAGEDHEAVSAAAHHLLAGVPVGDAGTAATWALRAARRSRQALAYADVVGWYERALATRRRVASGDAEEAGLLLELGTARVDAGRPHEAREAFLAAADRARGLGDPELLADAALGLGSGLPGFEVPLFDQVQIDLLEEALAGLPGTDSSRRAWVLGRLAVALAFVADEGRRRRLCEEAVEVARRVGDEVARAYSLAAWCDAVSGADHVDRRLAAAGEVALIADDEQVRPLALLGRRLRVVALLERGRLQEAAVEVEAFRRAAEALSQPLYLWYVPLWRATLAMAAGDLEQADRWNAEAERVGTAAQSDNARVLVAVQRFLRLRYEGRFDEAAALVARLVAEVPDSAAPESLAGTLVVADVACGREDRARGRADAVVASGLHAPREDSEWLPDLAQLADAATVLRHRELARLAYDALCPYAQLFVVEGIGAAVCGSVAHYLAGLARVLGRDTEAEGHAVVAGRLHRDAGLAAGPPPLVARVAAPARPMGDEQPSLRREGEVWALSYEGNTVRVRDTKGLRDLAVLLRAPGRAVHVCELTGTPLATTGEDLDPAAITAYRRRVAVLEQELAEAEGDADVGRAGALRTERDFLTDELASALGLGGRARRSGDPVERARKAVGARLRDGIARIGVLHPSLGRHLRNSVRTGTWCAYSPERPVHWRV